MVPDMDEAWANLGLNGVDYFFLAIFLFWAIKGLIAGLSKELSGLVVIGLALGGTIYGYPQLTAKLLEWSRIEGTPAKVTAFIASLLILWLVFRLIGLLVEKVIEMTFPAGVERAGGLIAGSAKAVACITVIIAVVHLSKHEYLSQKVLVESRIGAVGNEYIPGLYEFLVDAIPELLPNAEPAPGTVPAGEAAPEEATP